MHLFIFVLFFLFACDFPKEAAIKLPGYDLSNPDETIMLPEILKEISGLHYMGNNKIACVQDELGIIFIYDLASKKISEKLKFAGNGDYEGITWDGNNYIVLRSDGKLHVFGKDTTAIVETGLNKLNDCEGLAYNFKLKQLPIACKGLAGPGLDPTSKVIYSFDMSTQKLSGKPYFSIDTEDQKFQPSALEISPLDSKIYVLSANSTMIVVDPVEKTSVLIPLKEKLFKQPEGIAFKENGDMIISNEGKQGAASLLIFKYKGE